MMQLKGTIKFAGAYDVKGKDGVEKKLVSMQVVDEIGNTYSCQMWSDDPQQAELLGVVEQVRYQQVQLVVKSYTTRMRKMKNGPEQPQANFIMSNVVFLAATAAV